MLRRLLPTLTLLLVFAASLPASTHHVLGPDSQVMTARTGWSTELPAFEDLPATPALFLEITQVDGSKTLHLVPGTENDDPETSPYLLYEAATERLYMLWESTHRNLHSRLNLISWDGATFTETVELSGHPFSLKLDPRIAVTRDRATRTIADGEPELANRTVAHIVWWESEPQEAALYSPVIFIDGDYVGWNPVVYLRDLAPATIEDFELEGPTSVSPVIRPGMAPSEVVIGFSEETGSPLSSLGISVVPDILMSIGTEARSHILDVGFHFLPGNPIGLGAAARSHILDVGIGLSSPARRFLASEAQDLLLGIDYDDWDGDLNSISNEARSHILDVGFSVVASGMANRQPDQRFELALGTEELLPIAFNTRKISETHPIRTGASESWLLISPDGLSWVVAWQEANAEQLSFVENGEQGIWGDQESLFLGDDLTLEAALQLLQDRLDSGR